MKILLVNSPLVQVPPVFGGAIEMHTYKLAEEYASIGNEVDYITSVSENAKFRKGVRIKKINFSGSFQSGWISTYRDALYASSLAIKQVISSIKSENYDVIHHHDRLTAWMLGNLGFLGNHSVYTMHNPSPYTYECSSDFQQAIRKLSFNHMERRILERVNLAISVSRELQNEAIQRLHIRQDKVRFIPNGVDVEQFQPGLLTTLTASKLSLPDRYALFVGKLEARKGVHNLLRSMKRNPNSIDLVVAGGGPEFERLTRLVLKLGLSHKVHFLGPVKFDDLREIYSGASFLIVPSLAEGLPLVMLEGMSSGLPVVASKISGMEQVLEDGVNGFLISLGDVNGLAQAINRLWTDETLAEKMGENARKKIVSNYSWRSVALQLLETYKKVSQH